MRSNQLCEDCGMMFENASELDNHKKKFCAGSKYGALDQLEKNFQEASKNRDISKFGKMSLSMQARTYDFEKNQQNTSKLDEEHRNILREIEQQKNIKNQLEVERQKALREIEALDKQQEEIVIQDKRNNLQDIIARREALAHEKEMLQKEIREYQNKKKQWEKSQVKTKEESDQPYQQGLKVGKIRFQKQMLQERKHDMELQLNAKRRQKQKLEKNILQMSTVDDNLPELSESNTKIVKSPIRSVPTLKVAEPESHKVSEVKKFNYSRLNQDRPLTVASGASETSVMSSYLPPSALKGTEKMLKFNLNKQGKSQQDKLIQSIMAQQYDDLLILSKLPKGSELYNAKMKQYVQLSKHRMNVQEKAQKQRIDKMKKQFQFEKIIVEKQKINSEWVNQNRKAFMSKQVDIIKKNTPEIANGQSIHSIALNPSIGNLESKLSIPSGAHQLPHGTKKPSVLPNVPDLGSQPYIAGKIQSYPFGAAGPQRASVQKKDPFGYRVSVLSLRNYPLKKAIKIKLIIYEQFYHEKEQGMKYEFATIYHEEKQTEDPFNPHIKNKLDATGAIAYNESFYVPENLQELYNRNQKQIYLLIIAAEKDEKRITNEPKPYCWYSFKVTHFGQIKQGRFSVNMYGDDIMYPYPADMNRMKKKKQEEITFQVEEVLMEEHILESLKRQQQQSKPQGNSTGNVQKNPSSQSIQPSQKGQVNQSGQSLQSKDKNNSTPNVKPSSRHSVQQNTMNGSKMNMNYPIKMKNIDDEDIIRVNQDYFYSNQHPTQFSHVQLKKPLNFDVSVSGLRTLPSYIGPVKLEMSFIDADGSHVLPREQFLAEVSTDLYNPLVNYTRKIRNQARIPPSTIIFIRMIAISAMDYQVYSLGFSLIYLFLDKQGEPIKSNKITDYFMTSGYYQLPVFWGNIQPRYIELQQLLTQYPPIPCVSILIGILQNASKISNPMPAYSDRVYNTILYQIDDNQAKLFEQQYKREPIDTNTMISGYLQYKGIKKNYSGEEITKYLFKTLVFSPQNTKENLQLKWMAEYQQYFGINFVIDKLFVPEADLLYYYFITVCVSPPGNYYKKKSFDLNFCRKINFDLSTTTQFVFDDNQFFINPAYFKNASIIIEVNRIQIFESENTQADNNIEGFAYVVIPLFDIDQGVRAVNVNHDVLPLFDGDFDANNIEKAQKNLPAFLQKNTKAKKSKAEISIRLLNGFFMNQYAPIFPVRESKTRMYADIAPENMSFETALEDIASVLSSNYNMQIS